MRRERKLAFIKALAELDKLTDIRGELANKLQKKLEDFNIEQKELIISDLAEAAFPNEEFIETIITSLNVEEIISLINNRITNNLNLIEKIGNHYYTLLKILLKLEMINTKYSIEYINKLHALIQQLFGQNLIWDYWNNPTHPNYQNHIVNYLFKKKSLADVMLIHTINIYRQEKDKSGNSNTLQQIGNFEKFIIPIYLRIAQKVEEPRNTLVPMSIISIILDLSAEALPLGNFGNVNLNEIYKAVVDYKKLGDNLTEYLSLIYNINLIYDFLYEMEQQLDYIHNEYKSFILEKILDKSFYTDNILVDYHILLSRNVPEKYKKLFWIKIKQINSGIKI